MINRHFRRRNILIEPYTRTTVLLNPKVMTQFMRHFVRNGLKTHFDMEDPSMNRYKKNKRARQWPYHPYIYYIDVFFAPGKYTAFGFVRNPYTRTLSAWIDKFLIPHNQIQSGKIKNYYRSVARGELTAVREFAADRGWDGAHVNTLVPFDVFVEYVAHQKRGYRNVHWDVQKDILQTQHFPYQQWFRMEDQLEEGFITIFSRIGFDKSWIQEQIKTKVHAHETNKRQFYTPELAQKVYHIFEPDFEYFGYNSQLPESLCEK
jgi:hypothetical protein